MYQEKRKPVVMATRKNIEWVVEFTGRNRDEVEALLQASEDADVVCVIEVKE